MRPIYLTLGWIFIALGFAGIFLPLLPTTPFLILAAYCFSRSSERLHHWLLRNRWFGPSLRDWEEKHVIRRRAKLTATGMIVIASIGMVASDAPPAWAKIAAVALILGALTFIWSRREH